MCIKYEWKQAISKKNAMLVGKPVQSDEVRKKIKFLYERGFLKERMEVEYKATEIGHKWDWI